MNVEVVVRQSIGRSVLCLLLLAGCTEAPEDASPADVDQTTDAGATTQESAPGATAVEVIVAYGQRAVAAVGGPEAFARTMWAIDRGYSVEQVVVASVEADGSIAGVEPAGASQGLLGDAVAAGRRGLVLALGPEVTVLAATTGGEAQEQYVTAAEATLGELYEQADGVLHGSAGDQPPLDPDIRAVGTMMTVVVLLSLGYSARRVVEAIVLGEVEGRQFAADATSPDRGLDQMIADLLASVCRAGWADDPGRAAWREANCVDGLPVSGAEPEVSATGWTGVLPRSPLGAFTTGSVTTNEVVVEVLDGDEGPVAEATIVYEVTDVPVYSVGDEVLCVADILFTFEFAALPVTDPAVFELPGRFEILEGGREGDCDEASPPTSLEQSTTLLFTTSAGSQVEATIELLVSGERVYEDPVVLVR